MCTCVFVLPCVIATIPRSFVPILDACGTAFPSAPGVRPSQLSFDPLPQDVPVRSASQHPSIHPSSKIFLVFDFVHFFETRDAFEERKDESGVDVS